MYQKITLIGNLGKDPEMKYLANGTPLTNLNVATNNTYTNQQGEQVKETMWFRVSVFGKQAETVSQYLSKGKPVYIEGRLRGDPQTGGPRIYTRQDGTTGASFDVTASVVKFLPSGQRGESAPSGEAGAGAEVPEEDIPF